MVLAQYQLKQQEEARTTLAKGLELANMRFPKAGKGNLDDQWHDWIYANALMGEAKTLIQGAAQR